MNLFGHVSDEELLEAIKFAERLAEERITDKKELQRVQALLRELRLLRSVAPRPVKVGEDE